MANPLRNKRILLGVTGSIAAYKAADLASKLHQAGALVDVVLTDAAQKFITALTFQSLTGGKAYTSQDLWGNKGGHDQAGAPTEWDGAEMVGARQSENHVLHVRLAESADLVLIAPATANTLAKFAHGQSDDLLGLIALSTRAPIMIAPAMDAGMWDHGAVRANVKTLSERGIIWIGPETGHLASGLESTGRMSEPAKILETLRRFCAKNGPLGGKRVVVTAGGTREPIDPVREIANRSSGKQGFAIAQAALDAGADVVLIAAVTPLPTPFGAKRIDVRTTEEMRLSVLEETVGADALIMAAAPADFRTIKPFSQKIKKENGIPQIELERNPDILMEVAARRRQTGYPKTVVGFAAETENPLEYARAKMESKELSMIVANRVDTIDTGFETDLNQVVLLEPGAEPKDFPIMSKTLIAEELIRKLAFRLV